MRKRYVRKKVQKTGQRKYDIYSIGIPAEIASKIPSDMSFTAELTEDGLLFRPVLSPKDTPAPVKLPKWLDHADIRQSSGNGS